MKYECQVCGVALQGNAKMCVGCFKQYHEPCLCRRQRWGKGDKRPKRSGLMPAIPHCKRCGGEGWVATLPPVNPKE